MTQEQLQEKMKYTLNGAFFNDEGVKITDDTIHNEVLSKTDGVVGVTNSAGVYELLLWWIFERERMEHKPLPENWLSLSVRDLASKLIIFLLVFCSLGAQSQLSISVAAAKTELRRNAIAIGLSYVPKLDSILKNRFRAVAGKNTLFAIQPEANIVMGNQDAFSGIVVKATGLLMKFKTVDVGGSPLPDVNKLMNVFPFSVGIETNSFFNNINGLVEVGWQPLYQPLAGGFFKRTKFGIFLQTGYKFSNDSSGRFAIGGEVDESEEDPRSMLARIKGILFVNMGSVNIQGLRVGLSGNGFLWYDIANGALYHKIDYIGRLYVSETNSIDFIYSKGSGAPNFNTGDQYSLGLTVQF